VTLEHDIAHRYLLTMQRGAEGEDDLLALFDDNAEYVESFSGVERVHRGRDAIRAWLRASRADQPPGMSLTVERVDIDGDEVQATWSCASSVFVEPSRGVDTYTVRNGLIARLVTVINQPPTMRGAPRDGE
jgi:ketosteroid isomerase-like protein